MALKDFIATDRDRLMAREAQINALRKLLRDVYDVAALGQPISQGLLDRIRNNMASGRR